MSFLLSDGAINVIPDAAVRQWPFGERTDSTIVENLANDDGSVNGDPTNTADSSFYDGYYEATDGNDDAVLLPSGEFENQLQSEDWGFAFTVRGSSDFLDGDAALFGGFASNIEFLINDASAVGNADDGKPEFRIGNGSDTSGIEMSTSIDDSGIYRLFLFVKTNDPANWSVYLNDADDTGDRVDASVDMSGTDFTGLDDLPCGARSNSGSIERNVDCDFDNPILYDSPDRQTVTDDYQLQPFS